MLRPLHCTSTGAVYTVYIYFNSDGDGTWQQVVSYSIVNISKIERSSKHGTAQLQGKTHMTRLHVLLTSFL